jgi:hypothetical protein
VKFVLMGEVSASGALAGRCDRCTFLREHELAAYCRFFDGWMPYVQSGRPFTGAIRLQACVDEARTCRVVEPAVSDTDPTVLEMRRPYL